MGEKFVRGKKKSSLAEKNELGELVEKYDKNTRKNMIKKYKPCKGKLIMIISKKQIPIKPK